MTDIIGLLRLAKIKEASDLHLVVDKPPMVRVHGSLVPLDMPVLNADDLEKGLLNILNEKEREEFNQNLELDFGRSVEDVGRLRFNAAFQRGSVSIVIRLLSDYIPDIESLGVPRVCKDLIMRPRGLIIVSGPTGSGKSTTLAAMIDYLNQTEKRCVVTMEDPIEYTYESKNCVIVQREIGHDSHSFAESLRHVLRQDPDVILVGEMRDMETASSVLTVAETGHLVLTTGHAPSTSQAVERVINMFPPHERHLAQSRMASLILGILCQALVPKVDGTGRVAAVEVMLANPAVRNLIREGKSFQLPNTIRMNTQNGMELLDQALVRLYNSGVISHDSVVDFCNDREEIARLTGERNNTIKQSEVSLDAMLSTQFN